MRPFIMSSRVVQALTVAAAMFVSLPASAAYFQTDFESGLPSEITGAGVVEGTQGYSAYGFDNNFLRNTTAPGQPITLTLTGLPAHTSFNLDFLLAIIDSWDGNGDGINTVAPDYLNITVDGTPIFSQTFENSSAGGFGTVQSYVPPSGVTLARYEDLGFTTGNYWVDSAYDMGLDTLFDNIAHTASTLTIQFFANGSGWQGGADDESFAIDNIAITLNGLATEVPEPAAAALFMGMAMLAMGQYRRRRRIS
jgi:hypothetical protein